MRPSPATYPGPDPLCQGANTGSPPPPPGRELLPAELPSGTWPLVTRRAGKGPVSAQEGAPQIQPLVYTGGGLACEVASGHLRAACSRRLRESSPRSLLEGLHQPCPTAPVRGGAGAPGCGVQPPAPCRAGRGPPGAVTWDAPPRPPECCRVHAGGCSPRISGWPPNTHYSHILPTSSP